MVGAPNPFNACPGPVGAAPGRRFGEVDSEVGPTEWSAAGGAGRAGQGARRRMGGAGAEEGIVVDPTGLGALVKS